MVQVRVLVQSTLIGLATTTTFFTLVRCLHCATVVALVAYPAFLTKSIYTLLLFDVSCEVSLSTDVMSILFYPPLCLCIDSLSLGTALPQLMFFYNSLLCYSYFRCGSGGSSNSGNVGGDAVVVVVVAAEMLLLRQMPVISLELVLVVVVPFLELVPEEGLLSSVFCSPIFKYAFGKCHTGLVALVTFS